MKVLYREVKSVLNKSKIGSNVEYTINPYIGCTFGCKYCYASYLSQQVKEKSEDWGSFVYVKQNVKHILEKELKPIIKKDLKPCIMISSATDPYQPIEEKERVTRSIFELFSEIQFQGQVNCLTKSPLILRDVDLFKEIKNISLSMSICHANDKIKNFFEPNTPPIESRFATLKKLNEIGFITCVFMAPILPYYGDHLDEFEDLFRRIRDVGTSRLVCDLLNIYGNMERYKNSVADSKKGREIYLDRVNDAGYNKLMYGKIYELMDKYGFESLGIGDTKK